MTRRLVAALGAVLLIVSLAACGSKKSDSTSSSLDSVSFKGDVGKALSATWKSKLKVSKATKATTIVKGKGAAIALGDTISAYVWVGNGTTKKQVYSDYKNGAAESIPYTSQLSPLLASLIKGATYGSRVAAIAPASDLFGASGNTQLGVGADDTIVVVADLVKKEVLPTAHNASPSSMPKVVLKGGKPVGLDWAGIAKPSTKGAVQRVVLKQGKGAAVTATDTVTVNYLGETYQAKKPFDESYSAKPFTAALSGLVKGWAIGLNGVKVGSRVLLQIPPEYGYGAQGSGKIPGNATLWFVIDVVKAQ